MKKAGYLTLVLVSSLALGACKASLPEENRSNTLADSSTQTDGAAGAGKLDVASYFNPDGTAKRPDNWRSWVHVGTARLPIGFKNIIDQMPIKTAEYIETYVEPAAFAEYKKTGIWPEGTRIVKEFVAIKPKEDAFQIIAEDYYTGLALLIKDSSKFPKETGNLGYFNFGHHKQPYADSSVLMPREQCSSCHENLASKQQFIFADRHIGLGDLPQ